MNPAIWSILIGFASIILAGLTALAVSRRHARQDAREDGEKDEVIRRLQEDVHELRHELRNELGGRVRKIELDFAALTRKSNGRSFEGA